MSDLKARLRITWLILRQLHHPDQIRFHGMCPCGCQRWMITIPTVNGTIGVSQFVYQRLHGLVKEEAAT